MKSAGHVAYIGDVRNTYKILVRRPEADNQVIDASTVHELQRAVYALNNRDIKYTSNLKISVNKTKAMAMERNMNVRTQP
jgi:hypothetical protein